MSSTANTRCTPCCTAAAKTPKKIKIPDFYTVNPSFGNKVLLGNWFEERQRYQKRRYCHATEYQHSYYLKEIPTREDADIWNIKLMYEGLDPKLKFNDGPCYFQNFTSSNTIHYNLLPRGLCGPRPRQFIIRKHEFTPQADFTESYGNQTEFGLADLKYWEWSCQNYLRYDISTFSGDYKPPPEESLTKKRFTPPRHLETKTYRLNHELKHLDLRNKDILLMKEPQVDMKALREKMKAHGLTHIIQ